MLGNDRVFLIGPMGSGKSAVGKYLARLLRMQFRDSDTEIERRTRCSPKDEANGPAQA